MYVISVGKKAQKGLEMHFFGCKKVKKTFLFCDLFIFKDSAFTAVIKTKQGTVLLFYSLIRRTRL